mmetsp:Transcript_4985/g.12250  ORF Transcript_4985/g.12250 Transcript_4985/m.12250 type:complete len:307 (+) Transcript_4985:1474-2394(+)
MGRSQIAPPTNQTSKVARQAKGKSPRPTTNPPLPICSTAAVVYSRVAGREKEASREPCTPSSPELKNRSALPMTALDAPDSSSLSSRGSIWSSSSAAASASLSRGICHRPGAIRAAASTAATGEAVPQEAPLLPADGLLELTVVVPRELSAWEDWPRDMAGLLPLRGEEPLPLPPADCCCCMLSSSTAADAASRPTAVRVAAPRWGITAEDQGRGPSWWVTWSMRAAARSVWLSWARGAHWAAVRPTTSQPRACSRRKRAAASPVSLTPSLQRSEGSTSSTAMERPATCRATSTVSRPSSVSHCTA